MDGGLCPLVRQRDEAGAAGRVLCSKVRQLYTPNTDRLALLGGNRLPEEPEGDILEESTGEERGSYIQGPDGKMRGSRPSGKSLTNGGKSGIIKSSSKVIGQNGGSLQAESMPKIRVSPGQYGRAMPGTVVTKIRTFAGKGSKKTLRVEESLIKQYGGKKGQWQHTTGDVSIIYQGVSKTAEVHWFQEPSVGIVGAFVKRWR